MSTAPNINSLVKATPSKLQLTPDREGKQYSGEIIVDVVEGVEVDDSATRGLNINSRTLTRGRISITIRAKSRTASTRSLRLTSKSASGEMLIEAVVEDHHLTTEFRQ